MNNLTKIALAGMLATSSLGGAAMAQTAVPMMAEDNVQIVRIQTLNDQDTRQQYDTLQLKATDQNQMAEAQAEATADPAILAILEQRQIALSNVVEVETAANGGKIVYVR